MILVQNAIAAEITYDPGGRRDPFIPLPAGRNGGGFHAASGFLLEGIIYDPPADSVALIGGQTYKRGDTIGEGKVLEIQKDRVTIEVNSEQRILWIREEEFQKQ